MTPVDPEELMQIGEITGTLERPKSLDIHDRSGIDDIGLDDIQLPRLAIAQGLSPQLVPGEGKYIPGLVIGQMFNDVTGEIYGNGPLTVVPVKRHITRIEFDPNDRKVPLDREVPAGDPRLKWTKNDKGEGVPPAATEFVEYISLLLRPGRAPEKLVVSIKTTNKYQRNTAKIWTTHIAMRGTAIYSGLYTLSSKIEKGKNKKGEDTMFGVFVEKNAGFIPKDTPAGQRLFAYAEQFHKELEGKSIVVEREGHTDDETTVDEGRAATDAVEGSEVPPAGM